MYRRSLSDVRTRACARFDVHHVVPREQMPRLLERLIGRGLLSGGSFYLKGASVISNAFKGGGFYSGGASFRGRLLFEDLR